MLAEKDVVHGMMEMVMLGVLEDVLVKLDLYSNIQKKLLSNTSYSTQVYYWLKIAIISFLLLYPVDILPSDHSYTVYCVS